MRLQANENKALKQTVNQKTYLRIPIKTPIILPEDALYPIIKEHAQDLLKDGDLLFVTEKIVAISQNRAYPLDEIEVRPFARFLSKHVTKTPRGIGLGMPETMEMALREVGSLRIFFAAAVSAVGKVFKRKGDFYRIAGEKARAIDGPTPNTIPPFNQYVVLAPEKPNQVAQEIKALFKQDIEVAIVDINDFGGNIMGKSNPQLEDEKIVEILKDNPLGQGHQSTPLGIIRQSDDQ